MPVPKSKIRDQAGTESSFTQAATVKSLNDVLIRHSGDTEVRLRLTRGGTARVFEIPFPVEVTADLYGELKSLLGAACL